MRASTRPRRLDPCSGWAWAHVRNPSAPRWPPRALCSGEHGLSVNTFWDLSTLGPPRPPHAGSTLPVPFPHVLSARPRPTPGSPWDPPAAAQGGERQRPGVRGLEDAPQRGFRLRTPDQGHEGCASALPCRLRPSLHPPGYPHKGEQGERPDRVSAVVGRARGLSSPSGSGPRPSALRLRFHNTRQTDHSPLTDGSLPEPAQGFTAPPTIGAIVTASAPGAFQGRAEPPDPALAAPRPGNQGAPKTARAGSGLARELGVTELARGVSQKPSRVIFFFSFCCRVISQDQGACTCRRRPPYPTPFPRASLPQRNPAQDC